MKLISPLIFIITALLAASAHAQTGEATPLKSFDGKALTFQSFRTEGFRIRYDEKNNKLRVRDLHNIRMSGVRYNSKRNTLSFKRAVGFQGPFATYMTTELFVFQLLSGELSVTVNNETFSNVADPRPEVRSRKSSVRTYQVKYTLTDGCNLIWLGT